MYININPIFFEILLISSNSVNLFNFFNKLNFSYISFEKKSRIIVLRDDHGKCIYKYSCKESIREIQNNYSALKDIKNLPSPKAIRLINDSCGVVSSEELVGSNDIALKDFGIDIYINSTFKKACRILHAYHLETLEVVDLIIDHEMSQYDFLIKKKGISKLNKVKESILLLFNLNTTGVAFKSRIHGDFTYRNLRLDGENIFFIDFERSAFDFPEFDLINFILDFDIHNSDSQSYEAYVDYLVDVYIEKKYIKILEKLELNNIFKSKNIDNFHFIYIKYLIRQISIITNVSYYEKSVDIEKIYKSIINRIENHILTNKRIRNDCR